MRVFLGIGMVVVSLCCAALGEGAVYDAGEMETFMREWFVLGPVVLEEVEESYPQDAHMPGFEKDYLTALGGEASTGWRPEEGQQVQWEGGSAQWRVYRSDEEIVSLDDALSQKAAVLGYAWAGIQSDRARSCVLMVGHNDGGAIWLNGEKVWERSRVGGVNMDGHQIPIILQPGLNRLLLKVEERAGSWAFCCRLVPFDHPAVKSDYLQLFALERNASDEVVLRSTLSPTWRAAIMESATLTLRNAVDMDTVVWSGPFGDGAERVLDVDRTTYGRYILQVEMGMPEGKTVSLEFSFVTGERPEYVLFENGATTYSIVVGDALTESEQWAVEELQHWLKEVSGATFPVRKASEPAQSHEIVVGVNARMRALLGDDFVAPELEEQSFSYRNVGPAILIFGGAKTGTMYGVHSFLERELGCRWYTSKVSVTPKRERFSFAQLLHSETPSIRVRNNFFKDAFEPIWAARNRSNGTMGGRVQHGGVESYWAVHTFNRFLPPSEYFEAHPEYYSLVDGKRTSDQAQLCLSNPELRRLLVERFMEQVRKDPNHLIYSLSQNDWGGACQCEACQAIVKREGTEMGPILEVVNEAADALAKEFPDKYVGTLAYRYSRRPPKHLRPRENVVIRLCSFDCCRVHPFTDPNCPENVIFVNDIETWSKIAPHLYIWDYVVNFGHYIMPFPNIDVLKPNMQFLRDHNAIGIMPQGAYQSIGGEFSEMKAWVLAKLLWNPDADLEVLIDDFMYGYYGRAGQFMKKYMELAQDLVGPTTHFFGIQPDDAFFTPVFTRKAVALFDQAEKVADTPEILRRVEMSRLPIMYLQCNQQPSLAKRNGVYERFCAIVEREHITHFSEQGEKDIQAFHRMMAEEK